MITVLTPIYRTPLSYLAECVGSVVAQTMPDWELLLVDDGNDDQGLIAELERYASGDLRIRVITAPENLGIAGASQLGLEAARGSFTAMLDHDDTLSPIALERVAAAVLVTPTADYLYSDEDKIDEAGLYFGPYFKPGWSPELMRQMMYTCHLSVLRTALARSVGGFRRPFSGAQDYDLVLRVTERARDVVHIPEILYHWRAHAGSTAGSADQKPYAHVAAQKALTEHCERSAINAVVREHATAPGHWRIERVLERNPSVSLVLPVFGASADIRGRIEPLITHFVESVEKQTTYDDFEYVIAHDSRIDPEILRQLEVLCTRPLRLVSYVEPETGFNYSNKANTAAAHARGEYLIFLNDDLELLTPRWIEEFIGLAQEPDVGAVGGLFFFEDETIQHAGVTCSVTCSAGPYHLYYMRPRADTGYGNALVVARESLALTGAGMAVHRRKFFEVGGFTESLPNNFNDVDFCLKLHSRGYRNIWTPYVQMYHFESKTRSNGVRPFEQILLKERWGPRLYRDPFYNPNLQGICPQPFDDWEVHTRSAPIAVLDGATLDLDAYLDLNPDIAAHLGDDPTWDVRAHFENHGRHEGRFQSVRHQRPAADVNPVKRVRASMENFEPEAYLAANPDLRAAAIDPSWDPESHLMNHGLAERRAILLPRYAPG